MCVCIPKSNNNSDTALAKWVWLRDVKPMTAVTGPPLPWKRMCYHSTVAMEMCGIAQCGTSL